MKPKMIFKISIDFAMTLILLLLMTYERIGQTLHEWLGITIFVMFIIHHVLNGAWHKGLFHGKYSAPRVVLNIVDFCVLLTMLGSMVSGVIISRSALAFLPIKGGMAFGRNLHMISAYWGFILMSLHLGIHWTIITNIITRRFKSSSKALKYMFRAIAAAVSVYGVYAFIKRGIADYMLLKIQFAFFDFEEPLILLLLDYIAIMTLFVFAGHYLSVLMKYLRKKKSDEK